MFLVGIHANFGLSRSMYGQVKRFRLEAGMKGTEDLSWAELK